MWPAKLRQHPFLHRLQLKAVTCQGRKFQSTNRSVRALLNPAFPVGLSRRRAAFMGHSCSRQQPFCTSLQKHGKCPAFRKFGAKRCLTEPTISGPAMAEAFQMERTI